MKEDTDFLSSLVTCSETWLFHCKPESKQHKMQWKSTHSPRPMKTGTSESKISIVLIIFFDIKRTVTAECAPLC
jgi:hypothetical protein